MYFFLLKFEAYAVRLESVYFATYELHKIIFPITKLLGIVIYTKSVLFDVRTEIWCDSDEFQSIKCQMIYIGSFDKLHMPAVTCFCLIFFP